MNDLNTLVYRQIKCDIGMPLNKIVYAVYLNEVKELIKNTSDEQDRTMLGYKIAQVYKNF